MKYSSLFTHPSQTSINRAFDEVKSRLNSSPLFTTLHHSSPLFTQVSATTNKGGIRQFQLPSLLFLLEFDEQIRLSLLDGEERWRVVKSCGTSSPRQTPCLSGFARDGWRVKTISISSLPVRSRTAKIPPVKIYNQIHILTSLESSDKN